MTPDRTSVLHVIPGLGPGGAETMLAALVTAKRSQPFPQTVVDISSGGMLTERIRAAGVPVIAFGLWHAVGLPLAVIRLAQTIRRVRPTVIQSWLYYGDLTATWALALSGRRASTRLYWGVRCSDLDIGHYSRTLRRTIMACARRSGEPEAVVANSFAGREVHRQLGYKPRAFPVIPNGIDTGRFRPDADARRKIRAELGIADETPLILHVARVDPMKDHASLMVVAKAIPEATFVLAGAGTKELVGPPNVIALGPRSDMPLVHAAADIAISTSAFGEGSSNAIIESMASGVPAIATDVGDARAIVGDTGYIVAPRDTTAMIAAVGLLLAEPPQARQARGLEGRGRIVDFYSLDRAVAAFDALHLRGEMPDN